MADKKTPGTAPDVVTPDTIKQAQEEEQERDEARYRELEKRAAERADVRGNVRPAGDSGYRYPEGYEDRVVEEAESLATRFPSAESESGDGGRTKARRGPSQNK